LGIFEKISLAKMNIVGTYFPIGTKKKRLHVVHSFGGFLTRKKLAKLLDQYFGPNNTCEEVVVGTVQVYSSPKRSKSWGKLQKVPKLISNPKVCEKLPLAAVKKN
jgi:hypothetical protein